MAEQAPFSPLTEPKRGPRLSAFIPATMFLIVCIFLGVGLLNDPRALPSMMIDKPMPEFELTAIEPGADILSNADLRQELSLVNVFGSWCQSCLIEHPVFMRLSRENIIPIYGIDWRDKPGAGQAWLERFGNPYTKVGVDGESRLAIDLGVIGAPETFVVDAQGQIRYKYTGIITEEVWRETFIPLLAELEAGE